MRRSVSLPESRTRVEKAVRPPDTLDCEIVFRIRFECPEELQNARVEETPTVMGTSPATAPDRRMSRSGAASQQDDGRA
jgi:hypothetical protein